MNKKTNIILAIGLIVLVFVTAGLVVLFSNKNNGIDEASNQVVTCSLEKGKISDVTECNGEINKICTLRNGETCYMENLKNGKCEGRFSPKVLCDNNQ